MGRGKITYFGETLIDLTSDTVTAETLAKGVTAHNKAGNLITGTMESSGSGSTDIKMGKITQASNVSSTANTKITDVNTIGFTPRAFFLFRTSRTATSYHLQYLSFVSMGSYYIRTITRYSNGFTTSGVATNWTSQTNGYLYFNSNKIYVRSTSSYIFGSGEWTWVAIK